MTITLPIWVFTLLMLMVLANLCASIFVIWQHYRVERIEREELRLLAEGGTE